MPRHFLAAAIVAAWLVPARLPAQSAESCVVARIVDGDTFYCRDGLKVRPIGFDAPERGQGEIYGLSRDALARLLEPGDTVRLEHDVAQMDRYGRRLAWVWRDTLLVNEAMVAGGWGLLYTVSPNVKYVSRLEAAQRRARESGAGLWANAGFTCPPSAHRRREC